MILSATILKALTFDGDFMFPCTRVCKEVDLNGDLPNWFLPLGRLVLDWHWKQQQDRCQWSTNMCSLWNMVQKMTNLSNNLS